jgi:mercuric reductase
MHLLRMASKETCVPTGGAPRHHSQVYDLVIIGAGSAGFSAAITAAEQGAQVALVGHGTIGGTCTNVGCIPSKTLIRAAETLRHAHAAQRFAGISARAHAADWGALIRQKDQLVASLRQSKYVDLLPAYNSVRYLEGKGRLAEGGVAVNRELLRTDRVIITTGARPAVPPIPGIEDVDYLTSTSALALETLPRSLLVVGGGFIGAELAQMFARMDVKVTIVCRSRLLPAAEPEISEALASYFRDEGIELKCGATYRLVRRVRDGISLDVENAKAEAVLTADRVLIATGRAPNVEWLGLADARIAQAPTGRIRVDDRMRTTRRGTYAAGDVTDRDQFVYMAAYGAKLAAKNALNGDAMRYDNTAMPAVVFTDSAGGKRWTHRGDGAHSRPSGANIAASAY